MPQSGAAGGRSLGFDFHDAKGTGLYDLEAPLGRFPA
jgi:hypothetical protein